MKSQTKKNSYKYFNIIYLLIFFPLLIGCEDLFLRFKYETYECTKNYFKLKSVFIKNYDPGDLVDVEIDNSGYQLQIKENNESLMIIEREDPFISIRIEKKTSKLNVNFKNHIQNIECSKHVFKMQFQVLPWYLIIGSISSLVMPVVCEISSTDFP